MERKNAWTEYQEDQFCELEIVASEYKDFLNNGKTERECVAYAIQMLEKAGYSNLEDVISGGNALKSGDRLYAVHMDKALIAVNIGKDGMEKGLNIIGAHTDSPRLDVKQNPLYEDSGLALLDTHYYGGIKKYQWVTIPLALHGVVCKKDGTKIHITIGENEDEPVVGITDLLVHLSQDQLSKKGSLIIEGEALDVLVASRPKQGDIKNPVEAYVKDILKEQYGIEEEDFISSEIEIVPAGKARDFGLDKSMIIGYGHDDRVCSFAALKALIDAGNCDKTTVCILVDKEEVGSIGATGMHSQFFENTVAELLNVTDELSNIKLRRVLKNSKLLSADVSAAFDPLFAKAFEKKNCSYFGKGVVIKKFTGSRGKSGSNDANPEYIAEIRRIFEDNHVFYQTAEMGRVDLGGGGTIAYILAKYCMQVVDCGIPVLSMHAPWEICSKSDLYQAYKGYQLFLQQI